MSAGLSGLLDAYRKGVWVGRDRDWRLWGDFEWDDGNVSPEGRAALEYFEHRFVSLKPEFLEDEFMPRLTESVTA